MKRFIFALFMLLLTGFYETSVLAASTSQSAERLKFDEKVMLRDSVRIDGKIIYLGDLFSNTGDKGNIALAHSPAPGKRAIFDARWLYRVAKAYKLKWRPLSKLDQIIVQRTSSIITQEEIAEQLQEILRDQGADPEMEIHFSNRLLRIHVAGEGINEIGFENVNFDPRTNRFSAIIHAPAGDLAALRTRLTGRLYSTTEIPVAARRILKGELIRKSDIRWKRIRTSRLQNDAVSNLEDLIGKTPKRGIREGQSIRASSIQNPILVEKGSLVTIVLQSNKMRLTAQGKAVQPGSDGDIIRISNTQTNKMIEAEVIGSGQVAVRQSTMIALN